MKNKLKYSVLAALCVALTLIAGCSSPLDTDQFVDKGITLAAIAPNPVMRGGVILRMCRKCNSPAASARPPSGPW